MPSRAVVVGVWASVALAGLVGFVTNTPTVLGSTAAGGAIYLLVGIGLPQAVIAARTGSSASLGTAVLASVAGVAVLAFGFATGGVLVPRGGTFVSVLLLLVLGTLLGSAASEFVGAYRSSGTWGG